MALKNLRDYVQELAPGANVTWQVEGNLWNYLEGDSEVQIDFDGGGFNKIRRVGSTEKFIGEYRKVTVTNISAATQTVKFALGFGETIDIPDRDGGGAATSAPEPTRYMDGGPFVKINSGGFLYASSTIPGPTAGAGATVPLGSKVVGIWIHFPLTDVPGTPIPNNEWAWVKISPGAAPPTALIIGALQVPGSTVYFPLNDDPAQTMLVWIATPTATEVRYPITWVSGPA